MKKRLGKLFRPSMRGYFIFMLLFAIVTAIAQKFVLEAEDDRFDEILKEAVKICRKVEPDCRILVK